MTKIWWLKISIHIDYKKNNKNILSVKNKNKKSKPLQSQLRIFLLEKDLKNQRTQKLLNQNPKDKAKVRDSNINRII